MSGCATVIGLVRMCEGSSAPLRFASQPDGFAARFGKPLGGVKVLVGHHDRIQPGSCICDCLEQSVLPVSVITPGPHNLVSPGGPGQSAIIQSFCQSCRTIAISPTNQTSYRVSLVTMSPSGQLDLPGSAKGALVYAVSIRSSVCLGSIIPSRRKMHVDSVRRHGVNSGMTIQATRTAINRVQLR